MNKVRSSKLFFSVDYDFETRVHVNQIIGSIRIENYLKKNDLQKVLWSQILYSEK